MHHAVPHKFRIFQPRDHRKDPLLLREQQVGLEPHDIIHGAVGIFPPQLDIGPRTVSGAGVSQSHRAQRPIPHGIQAALRQHLYGHTALVHLKVFLLKFMQLHAFGIHQRFMERLILLLIEGAVDIIRLSPVVPGGKIHPVHIDGLLGDNGGGGIIKTQVLFPAQPPDRFGKRLAGQRPAGHDDIPRRKLSHLASHHRYIRQLPYGFGHRVAKGLPVHRQGSAGAHCGLLGAAHHQRIHRLHFGLQQSRCGIQPHRLQRIGAHQLRKPLVVVCRGIFLRLHFVQRHIYAASGQCPGGFAPGQSGPYYRNFTHYFALFS